MGSVGHGAPSGSTVVRRPPSTSMERVRLRPGLVQSTETCTGNDVSQPTHVEQARYCLTCTRQRATPPNVATTSPLGCSWLAGLPAPTPTRRPGPESTLQVMLTGTAETSTPAASVALTRRRAMSWNRDR